MIECDDFIPMCDTCGHRHVQGVRCGICGHVGKSQIFAKMRAKAAESRSLSVETLDSESFQSGESGIEYNQKLYRFIQLRMQVCREMNIPGRDESDTATELASNHLMCSVGDSPVAVARWQLHRGADNRVGLQLDRLVALSMYKHKGYAYRCIYSALLNAKQNGAVVDYIIAYVPPLAEYEWVGHKLSAVGFQLVHDAPHYEWCGMTMFTMRLNLGRTADGTSNTNTVASEFDNLLGYLQQKVFSTA